MFANVYICSLSVCLLLSGLRRYSVGFFAFRTVSRSTLQPAVFEELHSIRNFVSAEKLYSRLVRIVGFVLCYHCCCSFFFEMV